MQPGNLSCDSVEDDRSRDLGSAILSTQARLDMETKQTRLLDQKRLHKTSTLESDWQALRQPQIIVSMLEFAWEGHWDSECSDWHPHTSEAKIEVNDRWIQCFAQVRLLAERKGDSISLFEISPGIGWRADYMQPLLQRSWWRYVLTKVLLINESHRKTFI